MFWDLPNWDEIKFYYFQVVDLGQEEISEDNVLPLRMTKDELIDDEYKYWISERTDQWMFRALGAVSAASLGLFYMA